MREKDKLVKIYDIDPYNLDIIKDTLELMALKGWMLEDISRSRLTFRQYQPQPLRYAVTLLGAEDIYPPINKDKVYSGDQEDSDWHYVANHGKLYVFCNMDEHAAEIDTDPKDKLSYINTMFWKGSFSLLWGPSYMLFSTFFLLHIGLSIYEQTFWFSFVLIFIFDLIFGILRITSHIFWYIKAKKCIKEKYEVPKKVSRTKSTHLIFSMLIAATCIFYFVVTTNYFWIILSFAFILITFIILLINKRFNNTKKITLPLITIILLVAVMILQLIYAYPYTFRFSKHQGAHEVSYHDPIKGMTITTHYNDPLPLTLKDIGISVSGDNNKERDFIGSFLINETVYKDMPANYSNDASISYSVYTAKSIWLLDQVKNYYLNGHASIFINFHNNKILTVNGDKVYFANDYDMFYIYLIVYSNKIVFLHSSFELNQNQLSVVVTKLK